MPKRCERSAGIRLDLASQPTDHSIGLHEHKRSHEWAGVTGIGKGILARRALVGVTGRLVEVGPWGRQGLHQSLLDQ